MDVDLRVAELLCSRLCHDLISPIGAVNTGVEILGEGGGPGIYDEAMGLLTRSAGEAARRLKFFRMAYGLGAATASNLTLAELRELAEGALGERLRLSWPQSLRSPRAELSRPRAKLVLNAVALAAECLPRGGEIALESQACALQVAAVGTGAELRAEHREALAVGGGAESLTARGVQAHFLALLAARIGAGLQVNEAPGRLELAILFPKDE